MSDLQQRSAEFFRYIQDKICNALEAADKQARFQEDLWQREGGGGGRTRVMNEGAVFQKAGVNFSAVHGELPDLLIKKMNLSGPATFYATGISLVLHPVNPMVPTVHANFRYFEKPDTAWFGGGSDLTPYYPYQEDVIHFHRTQKAACDAHDPTYYPQFKKWCDEYFTIKHRQEMRGAGGIFFDYLTGDMEKIFQFVQSAAEAFLPAYLPIVERRCLEPYGETERHFQLIRRGRYVEFNLVYDRGTLFGLETNGRTESILMSLPTLARWEYDYQPAPGSREAAAMQYFQPQDWF